MAARQLTFAIGDIHGCLEQLRVLLREIEAYAPGGRVIFLGDLIDRGRTVAVSSNWSWPARPSPVGPG